jgi:uncharacterized oxidoreductase
MKTSNNTILITGGSAGIGFEFAKLFSADNKVIITGRSEQRLKAAASKLKNVTAIVSDVSDAGDVEKLVARLYSEHPDLNVLINNAGKASSVYSLADEGADAFKKGGEEMLVNYLSIVRLNERLLPLLRRQPQAAIVNVSSVGAIVPFVPLATYTASKAALHSYTQALRLVLAGDSGVKVFELMPPLVDTEFSAEIGGHNGIAPSIVAEELLKAFEKDNFEVHVGQTEDIYRLYLSSPEQALLAMNS